MWWKGEEKSKYYVYWEHGEQSCAKRGAKRANKRLSLEKYTDDTKIVQRCAICKLISVRICEREHNSSKLSVRKASDEARYAEKWDETSWWKKPTTETTLWCMKNETRRANQKEIHFYESQKSTLPWKKSRTRLSSSEARSTKKSRDRRHTRKWSATDCNKK